MAEWSNIKIPVQTGIIARIWEELELGETNNGKDVVTISCVANYYDSYEDDNQGSFWFKVKIAGDSAEGHYERLGKGDMIFVPVDGRNMPQLSSNDESEYISCTIWAFGIQYLKWGKDSKSDDKPRKESTRKEKSTSQNGSSSRKKSSRRKKKGFFGGKETD